METLSFRWMGDYLARGSSFFVFGAVHRAQARNVFASAETEKGKKKKETLQSPLYPRRQTFFGSTFENIQFSARRLALR